MKRLAAILFLMTAAIGGARALAEDSASYPTRTITMIIPFAVGGPADVTGRIVADVLARRLGRSVVVENVNGAGGTIGALRAARSPHEGPRSRESLGPRHRLRPGRAPARRGPLRITYATLSSQMVWNPV